MGQISGGFLGYLCAPPPPSPPHQYSRYCFIFLPLFDIIIKPHLKIQSLLGLNQNLRSSLVGDTNLLEDVIEVVSITLKFYLYFWSEKESVYYP